MKSSQITQAVVALYHIRRPGFVWGPPGVGKSDTIASAAEILGEQLVQQKKIKKASEFGLIDFRMALRDPTDIKGFPMPDQETKTMRFFRDGELPKEGYGILFMDELNSAAPASQAAGMQLTLTRRIGDYVLPDGWSIIGAGNRESDRGVVHRMPTPLANRMTHLDFDVNVDDWLNWAGRSNRMDPEIIAFIRFKPELLFNFNPQSADRAFATPRSWEAVNKIMHQAKVDDETLYAMLRGTVGEGPATELQAFLTLIKDLPTVEDVKKDPKGLKMPDSPATRHAIVTMLAHNTKDDALFERFMDFVTRMDKEFQVVYVRDCLNRNKAIGANKVFTKWALENHQLIN